MLSLQEVKKHMPHQLHHAFLFSMSRLFLILLSFFVCAICMRPCAVTPQGRDLIFNFVVFSLGMFSFFVFSLVRSTFRDIYQIQKSTPISTQSISHEILATTVSSGSLKTTTLAIYIQTNQNVLMQYGMGRLFEYAVCRHLLILYMVLWLRTRYGHDTTSKPRSPLKAKSEVTARQSREQKLKL